jgi:catechol 2,3-dioxygenase-like lactoylglutathione lyase family enzyme
VDERVPSFDDAAARRSAAAGSLHHVTITTDDVSGSLRFYDAALAPLGLTRSAEYHDEEEDAATVPLDAVGYAAATGEPLLWLVRTASGASATTGAHVAVIAPSHDAVDDCYRAAQGHGGTARQAPRRWEIYRPGYYGTLVADPAGNVLEAFVLE